MKFIFFAIALIAELAALYVDERHANKYAVEIEGERLVPVNKKDSFWAGMLSDFAVISLFMFFFSDSL